MDRADDTGCGILKLLCDKTKAKFANTALQLQETNDQPGRAFEDKTDRLIKEAHELYGKVNKELERVNPLPRNPVLAQTQEIHRLYVKTLEAIGKHHDSVKRRHEATDAKSSYESPTFDSIPSPTSASSSSQSSRIPPLSLYESQSVSTTTTRTTSYTPQQINRERHVAERLRHVSETNKRQRVEPRGTEHMGDASVGDNGDRQPDAKEAKRDKPRRGILSLSSHSPSPTSPLYPPTSPSYSYSNEVLGSWKAGESESSSSSSSSSYLPYSNETLDFLESSESKSSSLSSSSRSRLKRKLRDDDKEDEGEDALDERVSSKISQDLLKQLEVSRRETERFRSKLAKSELKMSHQKKEISGLKAVHDKERKELNDAHRIKVEEFKGSLDFLTTSLINTQNSAETSNLRLSVARADLSRSQELVAVLHSRLSSRTVVNVEDSDNDGDGDGEGKTRLDYKEKAETLEAELDSIRGKDPSATCMYCCARIVDTVWICGATRTDPGFGHTMCSECLTNFPVKVVSGVDCRVCPVCKRNTPAIRISKMSLGSIVEYA